MKPQRETCYPPTFLFQIEKSTPVAFYMGKVIGTHYRLFCREAALSKPAISSRPPPMDRKPGAVIYLMAWPQVEVIESNYDIMAINQSAAFPTSFTRRVSDNSNTQIVLGNSF